MFVGSDGGNTFLDFISGSSLDHDHGGDDRRVDLAERPSLHDVGDVQRDELHSGPTPLDLGWTSGEHIAPFSYTRTFNDVGTFTYFCQNTAS